jgi:hypothetical protein
MGAYGDDDQIIRRAETQRSIHSEGRVHGRELALQESPALADEGLDGRHGVQVDVDAVADERPGSDIDERIQKGVVEGPLTSSSKARSKPAPSPAY